MTELWRAAVGPYTDIVGDHGVDLVVAEAGMRYRESARFDDEIEISATLKRLGETSITTAFRMERVPDRALLTEAELRHAFVDPESFGKSAMPDRVRVGLARFAA
jgi:acyl-CoA thioester hydrolase